MQCIGKLENSTHIVFQLIITLQYLDLRLIVLIDFRLNSLDVKERWKKRKVL